MPKSFVRHAKHGDRIRTIHISKTRCKKIAFHGAKKSFAGHTFSCKPMPRSRGGVSKRRR